MTHRPPQIALARRALIGSFVAFALVAALVASRAGAAGDPSVRASADTQPPTQTIFASSTQPAGSLYLLITVHERGTLSVGARVGRYRYRGVRKSVPPHIPNQIRLKLSGSALRAVRRSIRHGKRMTATVRSTARDGSGNALSYVRRIKLRA
jgi:hypothetical protein